VKNILLLALCYLRFNKIKTAILVFSITIAIFLPLAVNLLVRDYQRDLLKRASATPLVAGAPGSRFDLVLHALYFRGRPAQDLTMADVDSINASDLALGIPIIAKHTARSWPIVGCSLEYFDFRGLRIAEGSGLTRLGDCVLGATAAERLKLGPGANLLSDPENIFDLAGSYPLNMRVKGILAPAGNADDNAVFVDMKTEWLIEGLIHGHQEAANVDPNLLLGRSETNITASAALLPFQEVNSSNIWLFHLHGEAAACPVSAIIAIPPNEKSTAILRGRYQDPKSRIQLLVPKAVVSETLDLVFRVKRFFDAQSLLVGVAVACLLALVILLSLRLRRGEMETMFKIGCRRSTMVCLLATEIGIVFALGVALAVGLSWLVVANLGLSSPEPNPHASTLEKTTVAGAKKTVVVVNYPLEYFARRIAGAQVSVVLPAPRKEDPAFWKPQDSDIERLQRADVIFLNGAEYEKWLPAAVLPLTRQIVTSLAFSDQYLTNAEVVTHSHGPQGTHSHGQIDFNTWMDPRQAALQAQSIHDALVKLLPAETKEFDVNLKKLQQDLAGIDSDFEKASHSLGDKPLLGSHPVYQYAARRYGWNLKSVHWEPDEMPSNEEWQKFEKLYHDHAAKIMVWEANPLPAVADRLRKMGIATVVFETCANQPDQGDYLSAMKANAERLAAELANHP
jgi:putative ABC transport system permease protein